MNEQKKKKNKENKEKGYSDLDLRDNVCFAVGVNNHKLVGGGLEHAAHTFKRCRLRACGRGTEKKKKEKEKKKKKKKRRRKRGGARRMKRRFPSYIKNREAGQSDDCTNWQAAAQAARAPGPASWSSAPRDLTQIMNRHEMR